MIEGISATLSQVAATQTNQLGGTVDPPTPQPSGAMVSAFAKAVATSGPVEAAPGKETTPPSQEIDAASPETGHGLSSRVSQQANALFDHLKSLDPHAEAVSREPLSDGSGGAASGVHGKGMTESKKVTINDSISQMEHAYLFAIEATLASHGSTEASKIFNTLLRGQ